MNLNVSIDKEYGKGPPPRGCALDSDVQAGSSIYSSAAVFARAVQRDASERVRADGAGSDLLPPVGLQDPT
jgi:hypothetical protein